MKRKLPWLISAVAVILVLPPAYLFGYGVFSSSIYDETYYGEFVPMVKKLSSSKRKKIIFIGTSSVPFGIYSHLLQDKLNQNGYEYDVVNFGLYIALGTKIMFDFSKDYINEGDIVIYSPEINSQAMSLYFSGKETWRALDSDLSLQSRISKEDRKELNLAFPGYIQEKAKANRQGKPAGSGVYASSSFDENCDLTQYDRAYNIMDGLYDPDNPIDFDCSKISSDFVSFVNSYCEEITLRGAKMYYYFSPMDQKAVDESKLDDYVGFVTDSFHFHLLGNPKTSIIDPLYFYDSNFHLNTSGMIYHTANIYQALKFVFQDNSDDAISYPEPPQVKKDQDDSSLNEEDVDCFTYEEEDGEMTITGLTEKGKAASKLTVPGHYDGKVITSFMATAFQNDINLTSLTIQSNIKRIRNSSFSGCQKLSSLIIQNKVPGSLSVAFDLLSGTDGVTIYVPDENLSDYQMDYFWGHYSKYLKGVSTL